jgi:hypothetical protein
MIASLSLLIPAGGFAVAGDPPTPEPAGYAPAAPEGLLSEYYADELAGSPLDTLAGLRSEAQREKVRGWLNDRFAEGRRLVLFAADTSEADRRHGTYFIIATAGLGDRESGWTTIAPIDGGSVAISGMSIVHVRETGFTGERFLRAARQGKGLLACNLNPDAEWSIEVDEDASRAELSVSLGPDAPSEMHSVFQDCKPRPIDELRD